MHIFYFSLESMSILEVRFSRLIPFLHISNRYVCWARPAYQAMLKILERLNVHFLFSLGSMSAGLLYVSIIKFLERLNAHFLFLFGVHVYH